MNYSVISSSNLSIISIFLIRNYILDKPAEIHFTSNNTSPLVNTSVVFSCTSDALPVAKFQFYRITGAIESEIRTSSSASTGVLVDSSIMHPPGSYNVSYKCVPYNMLGTGPNKIVVVNIQGMSNSQRSCPLCPFISRLDLPSFSVFWFPFPLI